MRLDLPTLFVITVVVTLTIGFLFLLSWRQSRDTRALPLWGVAHLCGAAGSALLCLRDTIPDVLSIGLGNAVILTAYGLIWSGLRSFEGRPRSIWAALAAGLVWLAACLVPSFYASLTARVVLASTLAGIYCALGVYECWRGRTEPLPSRTPTVVLMATYATLYWVRVPLALVAPVTPSDRLFESPWMPILCFGSVLFTVATAFLFMALTKERAEHDQRIAANTDPLTGASNRRAFVREAERQLADRDRTVSLLVFDLDHFKSINDRFGHGVGDAVLTAFAHLVQALLPPNAQLGRLGGEEFACVAPDLDIGTARKLAETLRAGIARIAVDNYPDLAIRASVGLVLRQPGSAESFDDLMRAADAALYRAKSHGRDRVEVAVRAPMTAAMRRTG